MIRPARATNQPEKNRPRSSCFVKQDNSRRVGGGVIYNFGGDAATCRGGGLRTLAGTLVGRDIPLPVRPGVFDVNVIGGCNARGYEWL